MLDRNEVALRFAVADYGAEMPTGGRGVVASNAVDMADALLAALASKPALTPPPPAASSGAGSGKYEPRVGDVCKYVNDRDSSTFVITLVNGDDIYWRRTGVADAVGVRSAWPEDIRFVRPATASERAAAGLPPAPAPVAERPEWVKVTGPSDACRVTVGKAYKVLEWGEEGSPLVKADDGSTWRLAAPGDDPAYYWPSWEPIPPPPAATTGKEEAYALLLAYAECDEAYCYRSDRQWRDTFVRHGWIDTENSGEWLKALCARALALAREAGAS